jgi:hypothetical protein
MIQRYQTRTIWRMFQLLEDINTVDRCVWMGNLTQNTSAHSLSPFLSIVCEQLDPASVRTSYCNAPLLTLSQNWSLWEPAVYQHHFPYWRLCFKLLFALAMLDVSISYPGISSLALRQKSISRPRSGCASRMPYPCGQYWSKWFWHFVKQLHLCSSANCFGTLLAYTLFKVESVVNDFMGRATTNAHGRDHFLNRHVII